MARVVLLDSGPLWLAASAPGKPTADACRAWIRALDVSGVRVVVSAVADYEVRREFILKGASAGLKRLDAMASTPDGYLPLTDEALREAAQLWAAVRRGGKPTAPNLALDADAIVAGQAVTGFGPVDVVTIATTNVRHLVRFPGVNAREWATIS